MTTFTNLQSEGVERAVLVHVIVDQSEREQVLEQQELISLTETAGATVVAQVRQVLSHEHAATLIGSGKLEELARSVQENEATLVICSVDLSGSQTRNIEHECQVRVIDRTQLILDIFASRAKTFEGKAQVKLAQLSYLLPRLIGARSELSRQGGGIGTRGPGETKLETDRRKIRKEITDLKRIVQAGGERRRELRRRRQRQGVFSVGIVGYTNAGKTTLLAELAKRYGEKVMNGGHNRLFDTLDLTTRRIEYSGSTFVFTDTVGFIRSLPHHLVDAFRATLEEAVDADVIVHVVDANDPYFEEKSETVYRVLEKDLHVTTPVVTLFNDKGALGTLASQLLSDPKSTGSLFGSVLEPQILDALLQRIDQQVGHRVAMHLRIPHDRSDILAQAYRAGRLGEIMEDEHGLEFDLEIDRRRSLAFVPFIDQGSQVKESANEQP
ncbi:MAG: GTPase HflX [Firmicutes bacterium]|nr:GTPase HflX [Bacillota bacterium]